MRQVGGRPKYHVVRVTVLCFGTVSGTAECADDLQRVDRAIDTASCPVVVI